MPLAGVLFFPVTPFAPDGAPSLDALTEHVARGMEHRPGGVFAACGTGEFSALSEAEHAAVVRTAVRAVAGRAPVFAGAGGPYGAALNQARAAREAGADGLLLMPPYLAAGPHEGLVAYVRGIAAAGLRSWVHSLHAELTGTGVHAAHIALGTPAPGHAADAIGALYWDVHTNRDQVELLLT